MTAEFGRAGIPFERIAAVDARNQQELASISSRVRLLTPVRMTDGEIACLLSHRACWSLVAAGDDAYVAVFEDDVVLAGNAGPLLADAGWVPAGADLVKLETFLHRTVVGLRPAAVGHGFTTSRLYGLHIGSAGYIVSKQAARALLKATEEIDIPVDHVLFNPRRAAAAGLTIHQLQPSLCVQEQIIAQEVSLLPSLLRQDREVQLEASGFRKPQLSSPGRVMREARRLFRQLADLLRLRRSRIIPFEQHSRRGRRPHTQRGENAI